MAATTMVLLMANYSFNQLINKENTHTHADCNEAMNPSFKKGVKLQYEK